MRSNEKHHRGSDPAVAAGEDVCDRGPLRVMVVEDDPFIAIDLEDTLRGAGFDVDGPYASAQAACAAIRSREAPLPDLATLDFELEDTDSTDVASALCQRNIPFVMVSATAPKQLGTSIRGFRRIKKPFSAEALIRSCREMVEA